MKAIAATRGGSRVAAAETSTPASQKHRPPRIPKENVDPSPTPSHLPPESSPFRSPSTSGKPLSAKNRSPLPPRPPNSACNPLKRKLNSEAFENGTGVSPSSSAPVSDSGVQVIVRMRPPSKEEEEGELIVEKISPNSVSILEHTFTFDSVADARSTQEDIFNLVGLPLVENCLSGFNSSIFAYGQTGSGKTYTMWGPLSALTEDAALSIERGLTPRVFERLFARIDEEQAKHADKQLNYQCRCSFLEIYNEQITDLLDPTQRNLQIREDTKTGVYVDYLTEEYVCTMKDVIQLLQKGLANRRTGETSMNMESSRSHCVFTCIVQSRSKSMADGIISLRSSRINLVDLAGSERQKQTGAAGERLKEAGNINRSLSMLGNLINILAEVSQSGKRRHIPYRDSRLTFLLQESLGGNAKLAMICAISPSQSCKSETYSTLRFAQRAKAIKNEAVVNEMTEDNVNVLREQIRQLKDEIVRLKSNGSAVSNGSYSTLMNARRSLTLLKMSLHHPTVLPVLKDDSDEEMEIDENDVEMPCNQARVLLSSCEGEVPADLTISKDRVRSSIQNTEIPLEHVPLMCQSAPTSGDDDQLDDNLKHQMHEQRNMLRESSPLVEKEQILPTNQSHNSSSSFSTIVSPSNLSIVPFPSSPDLQPPTLSTSPVPESYSRKSLRTTSSMSASHKNINENVKSGSGALNISFTETSYPLNASFSRKSKNALVPTEHLAASLQRGLQIIDSQQYSLALRRSSFRFSVRPSDVLPTLAVNKVDIGIQTLNEDSELVKPSYICSYCKKKALEKGNKEENDVNDMQLVPVDRSMSTDKLNVRGAHDESKDSNDVSNMQLVSVDGSMSTDKLKIQVPKAVEKVLAGSIRREMALEDHCAKQDAEIVQLNRLIQQYKHERECSAIIAQTREDKISRLEGLMDGVLPTEDFLEEEFISLANEHKLLKDKYDNNPEILRINIELKKVQEELDGYRNFFDLGERDVLMEEIQDLRSQLQYYIDPSSKSTRKAGPLFQLAYSSGPTSAPLCTIPELTEESADGKVELERYSWTEKESKWISLSEELRLDLEASRSLADKLRVELDSEKKCTEELKEALQTAMQGHARILEQYADLQEKHIAMLARQQKISSGIEDVKKAAAKAGVKGVESKFINSLAAEISILRAERDKERRYWRDENKGLQAQLRDTAEAVQAAGELLVRLKEAEEAASLAEKRALVAEQETEKAYQEMDNLKKNYDREIVLLNQFLAESRLPKEALRHTEFKDTEAVKYDGGESQRWREEFEPFCGKGDTESSKDTDPNSWFLGYDRCNM